jgi:hypothetical protein
MRRQKGHARKEKNGRADRRARFHCDDLDVYLAVNRSDWSG